jgi:tetratricopeptide (TPR) repeat protein
MAKLGRNEPCPCGSGKKYKHCCLSKDHASRAAATGHAKQHLPHTVPPEYGFFLGEDDLDRLSNRVVDLINDGRLQEAEAACHELKEHYPDVIDWLHRTAMLHEARGETLQALAYYERTLQYMDAHPEDFEELSRKPFRLAIERLRHPEKPPP